MAHFLKSCIEDIFGLSHDNSIHLLPIYNQLKIANTNHHSQTVEKKIMQVCKCLSVPVKSFATHNLHNHLLLLNEV
jgi:hypothetical protein